MKLDRAFPVTLYIVFVLLSGALLPLYCDGHSTNLLATLVAETFRNIFHPILSEKKKTLLQDIL